MARTPGKNTRWCKRRSKSRHTSHFAVKIQNRNIANHGIFVVHYVLTLYRPFLSSNLRYLCNSPQIWCSLNEKSLLLAQSLCLWRLCWRFRLSFDLCGKRVKFLSRKIPENEVKHDCSCFFSTFSRSSKYYALVGCCEFRIFLRPQARKDKDHKFFNCNCLRIYRLFTCN